MNPLEAEAISEDGGERPADSSRPCKVVEHLAVTPLTVTHQEFEGSAPQWMNGHMSTRDCLSEQRRPRRESSNKQSSAL